MSAHDNDLIIAVMLFNAAMLVVPFLILLGKLEWDEMHHNPPLGT